MTKHRVLLWILTGLVMVGMVEPAAAAPPKVTGKQAGSISALLPVATVTRGAGRAAATTEAKKGDPLVWNDLVKTQKGGRARITLVDQSILSLGSQAELRIEKHDSRSQQTALQLRYGRLRAEVSAITRDGGRFELRTPTAVAGVIGTDFGTTASIGQTDFLCISGEVNVGSSDPTVPGTVKCEPGMSTTVFANKAPTALKPATSEQIQRFIQDTEPAQISALSPGSALVGTTLDTTATGTRMGGINKVDANPAGGIKVSLNPGGTETSAGVHVVVEATAQPGMRVLTFTKASGQTAAAVFTILAPPKPGVGVTESKKPFLDVFEQERQSAIAGLNAIGEGLKQSADAAGQQLTDANGKLPNPLDLTQPGNDLQAQVTDMQNALVAAGTKINEAAAAAVAGFETRFQEAWNALLQRDPNGVPDDTFRQAANTAFNELNATMLAAFNAIHQELGQKAQANNNQITQIAQAWMNRINTAASAQQVGPTPAVDATERAVELGNNFAFDAGGSAGTGGAGIAGFSWVLCDPGYRPPQVGVPLAANAPGCTPLPGFAASSAQFNVNSCTLQPNDYIARVLVTDLNGRTSAMDVRVRVAAPAYDDPSNMLRNVAAAYIALQSQQFLGFFDESLFPGYATFSENIRKTFALLNTMNINLRISQANIACNDATVRADWELNYTFKADPNFQYPKQAEQLTVRMTRRPGRGWFITELQGDNGTVQGQAPGPIQTETALPDLQVSEVMLVSQLGGRRGATETAGPILVPVPSGSNAFQATVVNTGNANLMQSARLHFSLLDANSNEIAATDAEVPSPLSTDSSVNVTGVLNVPQLTPGTPATLNVTVNPGCSTPEKNCDAGNTYLMPLVVATVDLAVVNVATDGLVANLPGVIKVDLYNGGTGASLPSTGNLVITSPDFAGTLGTANIPSVPSMSTVTVAVSLTVPSATGAHTFTATINPPALGDSNHANDSGSAALTINNIDLQVVDFVAGSLVAGASGTVTVTINNVGTAPSLASTGNLILTGPDFAGTVGAASVPPIPPGSSADVPVTFTVPYLPGSHSLVVKLNPPAAGDTNSANDSFTGTIRIAGADLQVVNLTSSSLVTGQSGTITVNVKNLGPAASLASTGNLVLTSPDFAGTLATGNIPALAVGISADVPLVFTVPNVPGAHTFVATISPAATGDTNQANDTASAAFTIGNVDLQVVSLSGILIAGKAGAVDVTVKNNGTVASPASTGNLVFSSPDFATPLAAGNIPAVAAGATAVVTLPFTVPYAPGTHTFTAQINPPAWADSDTGNDSASAAIIIAGADMQVVSVTANNLVAGIDGSVTVSLKNLGPADVPAGAGTITLSAAAPIGTVAIPAIAAGATADVTVPFKPAASGVVDLTATSTLPGDTNPANDSASARVIVASIDIEVVSISSATPLIASKQASIDVAFRNIGTVTSFATTNNVTLTSAELSINAGGGSLPGLAPGATTTITYQVTLPYLPGSRSFTATISPPALGDTNSANDTLTTSLAVLGADLGLTGLTATNLVATQGGTVTVTVNNNGPADSPATTGTLLLKIDSIGTPALVSGNIPAITAGSSVDVPLTFTVPNVTGSHVFFAEINPPLAGDTNPANDTFNNTLTIAAFTPPFVDLQVINLAFAAGNPPFLSGETRSVSFQVKNAGNVASATTGNSVTCKLIGAAGQYTLGASITDSLAAGATGPVKTITFSVPANYGGADTITCTSTQDPQEPTNLTGDNSASLATQVNYNVDLVFSPAPILPTVVQAGSSGSDDVTVKNQGLDDAPAGWDAGYKLNGVTVGSAIGPALPAGATTTLGFNIAIPSYGTPPVDTNVPGVAFLNANNAVQETNTANNDVTATVRVVDFAITTLTPGPLKGVEGRAFSLGPTVSIAPSPYPLPLDISYTNLPSGLAASGTTPYAGINITGTPTWWGSAGTYSVVPSAKSDGVVHSGAPISLDIVAEQLVSILTTPSLVQGGAAQALTVHVTGGIYPITADITLPTGITTTDPNPQTLAAPGDLTWNLKADMAAVTGTSLTIHYHATDPGFPATNTGPANEVADLPYSVTAAAPGANYVITSVTVDGHGTPVTGANAIQVGEGYTWRVTVQNVGADSPTGDITIHQTNTLPSFPSTGVDYTVAAPAAGATVTYSETVTAADSSTFPVGKYTLTFTLTATPPQSNTADDTLSEDYEVVDFTLTGTGVPGNVWNIPVGGSGQMTMTLTETGTTTAFAIPVTVGPATPGVTFTYTSPMMPGAQTLTIAADNTVTSGTTINGSISATNHGVTKSEGGQVKFYTASIENQTLFLNDSSHPLPLAIGSASATTIELKQRGDFDVSSGSATLVIPAVTGFTLVPSTTSLNPGDLFTVSVQALSGASPVVTPIVITAQIPSTNPPQEVSYTLYVLPKGLPDLTVVSATPARTIDASYPWLSGEPLDWSVTVKNNGTGASSGGENVSVMMNVDILAGQGTVPSSLSPGGSTTVTVHTVYPDGYHPLGTTSMAIKVDGDTAGDMNYADNTLSLAAVNVADWKLTVVGANPLTLGGASPTGSTTVALTDEAGQRLTAANFPLTVNLGNGVYSSKLLAPSISPVTLTGGTTATVQVTIDMAAPSGTYLAQVVAQMMDAGKPTAQRQATIQIIVSGAAPDTITLTSSANNLLPATTALQINGPLVEQFTLTAGRSGCTASPCPGMVDLHFTDSSMTVTSPQQLKGIPYLTPQSVQVSANTMPGGYISIGPAPVFVSATAVAVSAAQTPSADPVGTIFTLNFNVGDLDINAGALTNCNGVPPGPTSPGFSAQLYWETTGGFNAATITWEWLDGNYLPVSTTPLQFNQTGGVSNFSGGAYDPLPLFVVKNTTDGIDGLQLYYLAATISNATNTATKYIPAYFDLSIGQNFCAAMGGARGGGGGRVEGFWGKQGGGMATVALSAARKPAAAASGAPDLRLNAGDISFTPSVPKPGDTVEVRFRVTNLGDADAVRVPIALQVNGVTVASDTFDVAAGRTALGGLQWANARPVGTPRAGTVASRRRAPDEADADIPAGAMFVPMNVALVIDPSHTVRQKTNVGKSAPLAHFSLRGTAAGTASAGVTGLNANRVLLELGEGACAGFRFSAGGVSPCGTADVELMVEDAGKGGFVLTAMNGIADLGLAMADAAPARSAANFGSQALAAAGHSYAVQLGGGKVGILTVQAVHNPRELSARAQRIFRAQAKLIRKLGADTQAPSEPGDVAGGTTGPTVFFEIVYRLP